MLIQQHLNIFLQGNPEYKIGLYNKNIFLLSNIKNGTAKLDVIPNPY
jgi:hypothetical protein